MEISTVYVADIEDTSQEVCSLYCFRLKTVYPSIVYNSTDLHPKGIKLIVNEKLTNST